MIHRFAALIAALFPFSNGLAQDAPLTVAPIHCSMLCQSQAEWADGAVVGASIDHLSKRTEAHINGQLKQLTDEYDGLWRTYNFKITGYEGLSTVLALNPNIFVGAATSFLADQAAQEVEGKRDEQAIILIENRLRGIEAENPSLLQEGRYLTGDGFKQWRSQLFDEDFLSNFDPIVRTAIHSIREEHLKRAVDDLELGHNRQQDEIDRAAGAIVDLDARVTQLAKETRATFAEVARNQGAIANLAQNALEQSRINAVDIDELQGILWGKMSSKERLAAINNGGFLRGIDTETRDKLKDELRKAVQIESAQEHLATFTQAAGDVLTIAESLGIDTRQARIATGVISGGAQIAIAFAAGNPLGVLGGVANLSKAFGGGRDASAERHAQIMRALAVIQESIQTMRREMHELHRQTMAKLDDLQRNMNSRFDHLTGLTTNVRDVVLLTDERVVSLGRVHTNVCTNLVSNRHVDNANERRVSIEAQFSGNPNGFQACRKGLREHLFADDRPPLGLNATRLAEDDVGISSEARRAFNNYRRTIWDPILKATLKLNPLEDAARRASTDRLFAALASNHITLTHSSSAWAEAQATPTTYVYSPSLNVSKTVNGKFALEDPIAVEHLRRLGDAAFVIAPTLERINANADKGPLLDEEHLRTDGIEIAKSGRGDARVIFGHLLALTDIARAQNAMVAGIALIPKGVPMLDSWLSSPPPQADWDKALAFDEAAARRGEDRCDTTLDTYNLACILAINPMARHNMSLAWSAHRFGDVARRPCRPNSSRDQCLGYRLEYNGGNSIRMATYLGMPDVQHSKLTFVAGTPTTKAGWKVALLPDGYMVAGPDGDATKRDRIQLSLPDWDAVVVGQFALPSSQQELDERRVALAQTAALLAFVPTRSCAATDTVCQDRNAVVAIMASGLSP